MYRGAEVVTESPIAWRNDDAQMVEGRVDTRIMLPTAEQILFDH